MAAAPDGPEPSQVAVLGVFDADTGDPLPGLRDFLEAEVRAHDEYLLVPPEQTNREVTTALEAISASRETPNGPSAHFQPKDSLPRAGNVLWLLNPGRLAPLLTTLQARYALVGLMHDSPNSTIASVRVFDSARLVTEVRLETSGAVRPADWSQTFRAATQRALMGPAKAETGFADLNAPPEAKLTVDGKEFPRALDEGRHKLFLDLGSQTADGTFDTLAGETLAFEVSAPSPEKPKKAAPPRTQPQQRVVAIALGVVCLGATAGIIALSATSSQGGNIGDAGGTGLTLLGLGGLALIGAGLFGVGF